MNKIQSELFSLKNEKLAKFNAGLIPNIPSNTILGIRTPELRAYANKLQHTDKFISTLPHKYFEENQVHAFVLSRIRDFDCCVDMVNRFLPYIDNWATCDQLIPKVFAKNLDKLLPWIKTWIKSNHTYTVRFAVGLLMRFYLGDKFKSEYADAVVQINSSEYYINMMRAWYFATALAKNWDNVIKIIKSIDTWTLNKTIQKSNESYRIAPEQKQYLAKFKKHS